MIVRNLKIESRWLSELWRATQVPQQASTQGGAEKWPPLPPFWGRLARVQKQMLSFPGTWQTQVFLISKSLSYFMGFFEELLIVKEM